MLSIKLNNGVKIPVLGLGTWQAQENEVYHAVKAALKNGYKHIDTATIYENEAEIGQAIQDSGVERKNIFLTTKLWNSVSTAKGTRKAFEESLRLLQTDYVDLYLIHWPGSYERILEVWSEMEKLYEEGKVRAIGVSNFNVHHLDVLLRNGKIKPAVNQVECHVKLQNAFLNEYCQQRGIYLEAYAPMMSWKVGELLEDETLQAIAGKHNKQVTQVALRYLIQRNIVVLPKSVKEERIIQNAALFDFELSAEEMKQIRLLNGGTRLFPEPDNADFGFMEA
ncbi:MAG: aldo/keto reductase [Cytophagales bacterium]|nr:aldo/keto reductase [Cytophagales bacterium]